MHTLLRLVATMLLTALLTLLLGPFGGAAASTGVWDKAAHFVAFGLMLWSLGVLLRRLPRLWTAALAVAIGGAVELIQGQTGRQASWGDLLADTLGVAAALALWMLWRRGRPRAALQTSNTR